MKTQWVITVGVLDKDGRPLKSFSSNIQSDVDSERVTMNDYDVLQEICDSGRRTLGRLLKGRS